MMKKITFPFILIVCLGMILSSCSNWLDVKPNTEMKKEDVFKSQEGFKDALTGVYIRMKSTALYGGQLTWGNIERLAQQWDSRGSDDPYTTYNYQDASLEADINSIFSELYKVIADANNILTEIDPKKNIFEKGYYELIKGEALAIRAYCHFDLLRLFGPIPGQESAKKILPYVTTLSLQNHPRHSYEDYTRLLEQDLNLADSLLLSCDPFCDYSMSGINKPGNSNSEGFNPNDTYWAYRQIRMNYWAVKGLKARFYLWLGKKQKAYENAMQVIRAKDNTGASIFRLGTGKDMQAPGLDYSLSCEHICAMHIYNLPEVAEKNFKGTGYYNKNKNTVTSQVFKKGTTDIRYNSLWTELMLTNGKRMFTIKKYWQKEVAPVCQIPLIRLSELYFIVMETTETVEEASAYYQEVCIARSINPVTINSLQELNDLLMQEYRKEFYAEGQLFYMYKRKNTINIPGSTISGTEEIYILPLPISEGR